MADPTQNPSPLQKIAALWQRNQPQILDRLAVLDRAAAAAVSRTLTPELRQEAASIAHKLAGSLGIFGFQQGTDLARQIEHQLETGAPGLPLPNPQLLADRTLQLRQALFPPGS